MQDRLQIAIFGDSIMKGTLMDTQGRYRPCFREAAQPILDKFPITILNHARFGSTIQRGLGLLRQAIGAGERPRYALIEYGGNDCNFDWPAVAAAPKERHSPAVPLGRFLELLAELVSAHEAEGVTPVLMSLPPISGERYFRHICRGGVDGDALLSWLGEPEAICRYQEMYSNAIMEFALTRRLPFINVRAAFLGREAGDFGRLIAPDGLHLSMEGYEVLRGCFERRLAALSW